jgi:hypothetical protein
MKYAVEMGPGAIKLCSFVFLAVLNEKIALIIFAVSICTSDCYLHAMTRTPLNGFSGSMTLMSFTNICRHIKFCTELYNTTGRVREGNLKSQESPTIRSDDPAHWPCE